MFPTDCFGSRYVNNLSSTNKLNSVIVLAEHRKISRFRINQTFICKLSYFWLTRNHSEGKEIAKIDFQIDLENRCVLKSKQASLLQTPSESFSEAKIPSFFPNVLLATFDAITETKFLKK